MRLCCRSQAGPVGACRRHVLWASWTTCNLAAGASLLGTQKYPESGDGAKTTGGVSSFWWSHLLSQEHQRSVRNLEWGRWLWRCLIWPRDRVTQLVKDKKFWGVSSENSPLLLFSPLIYTLNIYRKPTANLSVSLYLSRSLAFSLSASVSLAIYICVCVCVCVCVCMYIYDICII